MCYLMDNHRPFYHKNIHDPEQKICIVNDGCRSFQECPTIEDYEILQQLEEQGQEDDSEEEDSSDDEQMPEQPLEEQDIEEKNFQEGDSEIDAEEEAAAEKEKQM